MIEKFLNDQQDPKAIEKVYSRLVDLRTTDEEILYIAVQKKPIVNVLPDCIALTNKRILFFTPANLGLSMKFVDFVWKDVVDVQTKEEILGAVFSVKTANGAEMGVDYLPKIQARKLYQYAQERKEAEREARRQRDLEEKRAESGAMHFEAPITPAYQPPVVAPTPAYIPLPPAPEPVAIAPPEPVVAAKPDELTEKLKKLKTLFDHGLISQEEYNLKKMDLLSDF
ncbi:putative oligomerization/nucleic acid binding protein [Mucilaginibacter gracilis]|uniref:Putative oligomerization/nucleic acid binding protein n=1 Tax=Mucilaginibacter gracilis TaxID=423350 RepID=A0A495JAV4_9SPHI|nr:PH domain-containing protein [Mucilaginibacter gracilis]RKR85189.1 putative oligomerization/nucleic acid binding protein [Mucilaginibacter gracilis]